MLSWSIFGISGVINKPQMDECYDVSEYGETDKNAIAKSGIDTQSRDMYCTAISVQSVSRGTYLISLEQPCRTIYCSLTKTDNPECRYSNIGDVLSREVTKVDSKLCG